MRFAGIRSRHKQAVHSVIRAPAETAFTHLVVPWIFSKQTGENPHGHVRADAVVGEICSEAFPVRIPALAPLFRIIPCLRYRR